MMARRPGWDVVHCTMFQAVDLDGAFVVDPARRFEDRVAKLVLDLLREPPYDRQHVFPRGAAPRAGSSSRPGGRGPGFRPRTRPGAAVGGASSARGSRGARSRSLVQTLGSGAGSGAGTGAGAGDGAAGADPPSPPHAVRRPSAHPIRMSRPGQEWTDAGSPIGRWRRRDSASTEDGRP